MDEQREQKTDFTEESKDTSLKIAVVIAPDGKKTIRSYEDKEIKYYL